MRLVNGRHEAEGVVKVLLGERWYDVCDDMWDDTAAKIVCKQLGYTGNFFVIYGMNLENSFRLIYRLSSKFIFQNFCCPCKKQQWT